VILSLAEECDAAIRTPLMDMTIGQLALLILQEADLVRVMPRAISTIAENPYIMAEHYRGDLLRSVLRVNAAYWAEHQDQWLTMHSILHDIEGINAEIADAKFAFFDLK
jgi:CDI immunity proteins